MIRTYKYRAYCNNEVAQKAGHWLDLCRWLYNCALEERISVYKTHGKSLYLYDQQHELTGVKKHFKELQEVDSQVLLEVLGRLDTTFLNFFRWVKNGGNKVGYPRFKTAQRFNSLTFRWKSGWKLEGKYLRVSKLGTFKLKLSRDIVGKVKKVTLKRAKDNKWYAYFVCIDIPGRELCKNDLEVGIDVGIKTYVADSNGWKTANPLYFKQAEGVIRRRTRRLNRRGVGTNGHEKSRVLVAKAWDKVSRQRDDFLHKLANKYICTYGVIYIENISIGNLRKNKNIRKYVLDSAWGKFFDYLIYKAEETGREIIAVHPKHTSTICSRCGEFVYKRLSCRIHRCPSCGLVMDRDENAACNILRVGQIRQALTKDCSLSVACESLQKECQDDTFTFHERQGVLI